MSVTNLTRNQKGVYCAWTQFSLMLFDRIVRSSQIGWAEQQHVNINF
jgi:hypothetical protein